MAIMGGTVDAVHVLGSGHRNIHLPNGQVIHDYVRDYELDLNAILESKLA
ncbi:MAG TPA: hypothetical protein VEG61_08775 [Candidatus Dormibacteraeota bacterium]|nr:hypothetical protein [Candidatus Dormibacteraeota bacterium]